MGCWSIFLNFIFYILYYNFFIIILVSFVLGAKGLAGLSLEIGQLVLAVFPELALFASVISLLGHKKNKSKEFK